MTDREPSAELQSEMELQPESPPTYVADGERFARVVRAIEGEIIPRFLMSFVVPLQAARVREPARLRSRTEDIRHDDVPELARLLLSGDGRVAGAFIQAVLGDEDVSLDRVCLELLAPAARYLRELWENGECDFAEFATGMERLLKVLRFVIESRLR